MDHQLFMGFGPVKLIFTYLDVCGVLGSKTILGPNPMWILFNSTSVNVIPS